MPEQRIAEQAVRLPPGGAVTGWAALRLHQAAYFDGLAPDGRTPRPVPLACGEGPVPRKHSSVTTSVERLEATEIVVVGGTPCTVPCRALFDEARSQHDWREAVVDIDMAVAAGVVDLPTFEAYVGQRTRWKRSTTVKRALRYTSDRSRSPAEVRTRLTWELDAGLPRPLVNQDVFDLNGSLVCVADLLDEEAGLVVEYDGAVHRGRARHAKDVRREEACRRLGLEYCKVTAADSSSTIVARFRSTRSRALFRRPEERSWTLERPKGSAIPASWLKADRLR